MTQRKNLENKTVKRQTKNPNNNKNKEYKC